MTQAHSESAAVRQDSAQKTGFRPSDGRHPVLFWSVVALVSAACVFVLPFAFPQPTPTFSNSYAYGFNNRIAELSAVALSTGVLLWLWLRGREDLPRTQPAADTISRGLLLLLVVGAAIFVAVLGGAMIDANIFYSDASHILTQLARVLNDHAALYRDVELPYGPLFFYLPAATIKAFGLVGVRPVVAYLIALATMQIAGIGMLAYILQWLPLSRRVRAWTLCLVTFAAMTPLLGINYTLFRFLLPHTLLLAIARSRPLAVRQSALFFLAGLVCVSFSPEIGLAFIAGTGCYSLYRCWADGPLWLLTGASPLVSTAVFAILGPREYLHTTGSFAAGAFNIIVAPDLHVIVLLIAAIALAPVAVARYMRHRDASAAAFLGFYIISLGMLAPAFGRCDALHTFFGGLGMYLLSLVAVSGRVSIPARLWVVALFVAIAASQIEDIWIYRELLLSTLWPARGNDGVDMARLEALTQTPGAIHRIAAPIVIPQRVSQQLTRLHQFQPSYFVYMGGVWDDAAERRKIADMRQAPFALIPDSDYKLTHDEVDMSRHLPILHTPIPYRQRFTPWVQGAGIERELREHWTPVGSVGEYLVYRQNIP